MTPNWENWSTICSKPCTKHRGIGLAATQVNVHKRVVVMDLSEDRSEPLVLINPEYEILDDEREQSQEGCLSVPGFYETVERANHIRLKAMDRDGTPLRA